MTNDIRVLVADTALPLTYTEGLEDRLRDRLRIRRLRAGSETFTNRLALSLALVGPGLLVMLGDNDAGGVITYAQTGATYGISLFIPLMIPLAFAFAVGVLVFLKYCIRERIALFIAALNVVFVPLALFSHPDWAAIGRTFTGASGWACWLGTSRQADAI